MCCRSQEKVSPSVTKMDKGSCQEWFRKLAQGSGGTGYRVLLMGWGKFLPCLSQSLGIQASNLQS